MTAERAYNGRPKGAVQPMLVALHGPAGSGKTFCAEIFMGQTFVRVKFADALKNMLRVLLHTSGVPVLEIDRYIEGDLKEQPTQYLSGASPRVVMQGLGQWGREIDPMFWVTPTINKSLALMKDGYDVVIDDCRYENEAEAILSYGGRVVQVVGRRHTVPVPDHASEVPLHGSFITDAINNTGDITLARAEVHRIIKEA